MGGTPLIAQSSPAAPAGLTSDLLQRRPDILRAEHDMMSANAEIGVAVANFFPRIGLTALYGGESDKIGNVLKNNFSIWNIAGNVSGPIFQGGRLAAQYRARQAFWDETIAALLRAALYYDAGSGPFAGYAHTAIHRACWRYVCRQVEKRPLLLVIASVDRDAGTGDDSAHPRHDYVDLDAELAWPSAEDEVLAREAARRAWLLREHAALAATHGDDDTVTRLRDAATEATTVARATRRRSAARR